MTSSPACADDDDAIVRRFSAGHLDRAPRGPAPRRRTSRRRSARRRRRSCRCLTCPPAPSPTPPSAREIDVDFRHVGAGEIVDDDVVGAAERVELDALDVVRVHRHVGDVAEEQHAPAVGGDLDVLGDVGAVEQHRVEAGLALDRVVVVARVPDEGVVARAHERRCRCRRRR